ncbi:MAG: aldo/keto reductase [Solirubrobacterales bacterium]
MEASAIVRSGTVRLGPELEVRRLGFGALRITGNGIWGDPPDVDSARALLRRVIELGVNFIDTADSYGPEVSERLIAEALHPYPDDLVIGTKGGLVRPGPDQWKENGRPEHLREQCEASLMRLRLERIDLYQLHRVDPDVSLEESIGALVELREEGKIREIGVSNQSAEQLERSRALAPVVSVQNRYGIADRDNEDVIDICARDGLAFIPWYPLGAGDAGGYEIAQRIAEGHGATPWQVAIAWLLARSPVMLPIPGTSSGEHLEENIAAAELELSAEQLAELTG